MKSKSNKAVRSFKSALVAAASSIVMAGAFAATIDGTTQVRIGGRVQSVDTSTHQVTVINGQGGTESFQVGNNVPNLDKLKAGTNVVGTSQRAVRLTVLDASSLAAVPSPDGNQVVASVARVDGSLMTLKDTQGAVLTVQANSPAAAATVIPGTRVLVNLANSSLQGSGKAVK
ncbi:hypothetical protein [Caballeronia sordidicola]|jgi:hypothetical protein|uniref:Uncharacterized protein n=1 Tax=Caballeronia sordidicola TaxID=196367 RepID=A0A226X8I8_CABSO|nr:hypothetical protein [Caballeronia sordidicola]OXC79148.1 hypothetical protein BSU04_08240 [Caballeronia sordidicola]